MPRSSRSSPRPAPSRSAPAPAQQRPMTTTAYPPARTAQQAPPTPAQQAGQSPGLFGQMASTAAGVAVGSSIGHAIGGFFGGGSSAPPAEQQQQGQYVDAYAQQGGAMDSGLYNSSNANAGQDAGPCAMDMKKFTDCMTQNQGNMNVCSWYLDQWRACQSAAGMR